MRKTLKRGMVARLTMRTGASLTAATRQSVVVEDVTVVGLIKRPGTRYWPAVRAAVRTARMLLMTSSRVRVGRARLAKLGELERSALGCPKLRVNSICRGLVLDFVLEIKDKEVSLSRDISRDREHVVCHARIKSSKSKCLCSALPCRSPLSDGEPNAVGRIPLCAHRFTIQREAFHPRARTVTAATA